jgi:outer membrane protein assembly factor BamB
MSKIKINAREAAADIKAGIHDSEIMAKYSLSAKGLESLFTKLKQAGLLTQSDLDRRATLRENTVVVDLSPLPTSQLRWKFQAGDVIGTPVIQSGIVYFGSWDGNFYAFEVESGKQKWKFVTGGAVHAKPSIASKMICFGSGDHNLYCLDLETGQLIWNFQTEGPVYSTAAISGGMIYFGSSDGFMYAVELRTGIEKWKYKTNGPVHTSPAFEAGVVVFGSDDKCLYVLETAGGRVSIQAWTE